MTTFYALHRPQVLIFGFILAFTLATTPNVSGQWMQTNGPYGGLVTSVITFDSNLFAGTFHGIFRSTDHGASWGRIGLENSYFTALVGGNSNLFAGTVLGELFRSSDNGIHWTVADSGFGDRNISALVVKGSKIFAAEPNAGPIYVSTDEGLAWSRLDSGLSDIQALISANGNLYAGTSSGIFRSTNDGHTWNADTIGLSNYTSVNALTSSGSLLFAGTSQGLFESVDSGISWLPTSAGLPTSFYVITLASNEGNLVAGTRNGVFCSTDSGKTWHAAITGPLNPIITAAAIMGETFYCSTNGAGVFRSPDSGYHWLIADSGMIGTSVALAQRDSELFAGVYGGGVFATTNGGAGWNARDSGLTAPTIGDISCSGTTLLAGTGNGDFLSFDDGSSWARIDSLRDVASTIYGKRLLRAFSWSADSGRHWTITNPPDGMVLSYQEDDSVIFAGCLVGDFGSAVCISTDSAMTWTPIIEDNSDGVFGLAVMGPYLFAGVATNVNIFPPDGEGGIYKWESGDSTWSRINTGWNEIDAGALMVSGANVFAATSPAGILLSTDSGMTWNSVNSGFRDSLYVDCFIVNGGYLYAGTNGDGVWRRPLSEMISAAAVKGAPSPAQVSAQAYPNPFPTETTIAFTAPESGFARVWVVNLLGQPVAQLFEGALSAGEHSLAWDATNVPAGTYFCLIQTSAGRQVVSVRHE